MSGRAGLLMLALLLPGCGRGPGPVMKPCCPVEGWVFVDGKPAEGAVVMFHPLPLEAGRFDMIRSRGTVDEGGRFRLTTYNVDDGAPAGEYAVTVYWPGKRTGPAAADEESTDLPPDRLGLRYTKPASSEIRVEVRPPEMRLEPFELK